ncbi:hypothetical protein BZA77DRAFT_44285 [Pyronema omphalodes]|nr:hypothetical protein BZA77DRAFT_44285 [Pyronema omphalodes]
MARCRCTFRVYVFSIDLTFFLCFQSTSTTAVADLHHVVTQNDDKTDGTLTATMSENRLLFGRHPRIISPPRRCLLLRPHRRCFRILS